MRVLGMVVAVLILVTGCASAPTSTPTSTPAPATGGQAITIKNFMFMPMTITVAPGAKISVTNDDSATHTLTATGKAFDTGDIAPGKTVTVTAPAKPGTYGYLCDIHQYMTGTIVVDQAK